MHKHINKKLYIKTPSEYTAKLWLSIMINCSGKQKYVSFNIGFIACRTIENLTNWTRFDNILQRKIFNFNSFRPDLCIIQLSILLRKLDSHHSECLKFTANLYCICLSEHETCALPLGSSECSYQGKSKKYIMFCTVYGYIISGSIKGKMNDLI